MKTSHPNPGEAVKDVRVTEDTLTVVLDGPDDPERLPVQRIQPEEGQVTWFVDREAARLVK